MSLKLSIPSPISWKMRHIIPLAIRSDVSLLHTGRRTNRLNTAKEKVWPEELEIALFRALESYYPLSTKDPLSLQRFPSRNKYIAGQILKMTGKWRTPKQVGSRLQQLRETSSDPYVLELIQSKNFDQRPRRGLSAASTPSTLSLQTIVEWNPSEGSSIPSTEASSLSGFSSVSSPELFQNTSASPSSSLPPYSFTAFLVVYVSLFEFDFCASSLSTAPYFTLDLDEHPFVDYAVSSSDPQCSTFTRRVEIRSPQAISQCTPVVKFSSQRFLPDGLYQCITEVRRGDESVYSVPALLERCGIEVESTVLSMPLLPDFWAVITSNPEDYSSYTIDQKIYCVSNGVPQLDYPLFSIHYTMERGLNLPSYIIPDTFPPPPYLGELALQNELQNLLHFQYPAEIPTTGYSDTAPLPYPTPQLPYQSFFTPPSQHDPFSIPTGSTFSYFGTP